MFYFRVCRVVAVLISVFGERNLPDISVYSYQRTPGALEQECAMWFGLSLSEDCIVCVARGTLVLDYMRLSYKCIYWIMAYNVI